MANNLALVSSHDESQDGPESHDELGAELEAMATIGRALDSIQDPALRQRILNWAVERWGDNRTRAALAEGPVRTAVRNIQNGVQDIVHNGVQNVVQDVASDPSLAVDSIDDLFGDEPAPARPGKPPEIIVPEKSAAKAPVETMLQSLAADFQRLADEWNGDAKS